LNKVTHYLAAAAATTSFIPERRCKERLVDYTNHFISAARIAQENRRMMMRRRSSRRRILKT